MWVSKKKLVELEEKLFARVDARMEAHKRDFHTKPQLYCETCGCLLQQELAVAGDPVLRKEHFTYGPPRYVIHYPYFCKIHNSYPEHP